MRDILKEYGYSVIEAFDGEDAVARKPPSPGDLLRKVRETLDKA